MDIFKSKLERDVTALLRDLEHKDAGLSWLEKRVWVQNQNHQLIPPGPVQHPSKGIMRSWQGFMTKEPRTRFRTLTYTRF